MLSSKHVSSILAVLAAFIIGDGEQARMVLHAMAAQRISHAVTALILCFFSDYWSAPMFILRRVHEKTVPLRIMV